VQKISRLSSPPSLALIPIGYILRHTPVPRQIADSFPIAINSVSYGCTTVQLLALSLKEVTDEMSFLS
jgi:hypothetical protein